MRWRHARRPPRPRHGQRVRRLRTPRTDAVRPCRASLPAVPSVRWPQPATRAGDAMVDGRLRRRGPGDGGGAQGPRPVHLPAGPGRPVGRLRPGGRGAVRRPRRSWCRCRRGPDRVVDAATTPRRWCGCGRAGASDATAAPLLVSSRRVADQAGLSASERASNLAGSMSCPSPGLGRLARRRARGRLWSVTTCSPPARRPRRHSEPSLPWAFVRSGSRR